ncbi:MAG: MucR family transcriptional regulator [Pseudomonadota bacterium]|jgi:predicted transcriptional regulator|nr:transcriptional regulator [Alphaproteobacteria bacterium]
MKEDNPDTAPAGKALRLTADIIKAYLRNNALPKEQLSSLILLVHKALSHQEEDSGVPANNVNQPAVPVRKSITPDYLICLEDGRQLKMLKRYLRSHFKMTPDEYRAKWGLPADYPMVAPNYARKRSEFARQAGLGHGATPRRKKT